MLRSNRRSRNLLKIRRINLSRARRYATFEIKPQIFRDCKIYVHHTRKFRRRQVLRNLIKKNGGSYTRTLNNETTHVLVEDGISSASVCTALGWSIFPTEMWVLRVSWLSDCVKANKLLDTAGYLIPCTHKHFEHNNNGIEHQNIADNVDASDVSSSSINVNEDADDEDTFHLDFLAGDGSTYDDGKYDEETSCDDEWLSVPPYVFSDAYCFISTDLFPLNPCSSELNINLVETKMINNVKSDTSMPPPNRPNTLAARLSRFRVRRIPKHLRVPGKSAIVVDVNSEDHSQRLSKNVEISVQKNNNEAILQNNLFQCVNESMSPGSSNIPSKSKVLCSVEEHTDKIKKNIIENQPSTNSNECVSLSKSSCNFQNEETDANSLIEVSSNKIKNKKFKTVHSSNKELDLKSFNEVHQVINMIVESVVEVAANEKVINESVAEISKNILRTEDFIVENSQEYVLKSLITDTVLRVADRVGKVLEERTSELPMEIMKNEVRNNKKMDISYSETETENELKISNAEVTAENKENVLLIETKSKNEIITDVLMRTIEDIDKLVDLNISEFSAETMAIKAKNIDMDVSCTEKIDKDEMKSSVAEPMAKSDMDISNEEAVIDDRTKIVDIESIHKIGINVSNSERIFKDKINISKIYPNENIVKELIGNMLNEVEKTCKIKDDRDSQISTELVKVDVNIKFPEIIYLDEVQNSYNLSNKISLQPTKSSEAQECGITNVSIESKKSDPSLSYNKSRPDVFIPSPNKSQNINNPEPSSQQTGALRLDTHPNKTVIKFMKVLYEFYKKAKNRWRVDTYEKAILSLRKYPKLIGSLEEIQNLSGMSRKIANKVWEIVQTGYLKEINVKCCRKWVKFTKSLSKAWGITPRIASKLYEEGYSKLQELENNSYLTQDVRLGLVYYKDLRNKMLKEEAEMILKKVMKEIFRIHPFVLCDGCSSLRRNKKTCGHVSVLVALPRGCKNDHRLLPAIVAKLHQRGYLVDDLVRHEENGAQTKYVGIIKLKSMTMHRRINITVCARVEYACALMYLTGSSYFNRAIQQRALKRNMVLDEHSLSVKLNINGGTKAETVLYTPDEATIFKFLDLPYRSPEHRERSIDLF
ncbi:DNA polymerase lambda [Caerostris darwini]|uniref:DNA polymerase lambda n=1 Tax=Caerostris darwini TaxID=1538125 RepID=A0AAV4S039_9ARAC|nr:DNA polymerase lambda [Caerostris darwini]